MFPNMHSIAFTQPLAAKPELNKRDQVLIGYRSSRNITSLLIGSLFHPMLQPNTSYRNIRSTKMDQFIQTQQNLDLGQDVS
jgi:hypothetical protein